MSKFKEYLEVRDTMRSGSGIMRKAYDDLGNDPKSFGDRFSSEDMRARQKVIMRIDSITDIIKNIGSLKEDLSKNYHELKTDVVELNSKILRDQANELLNEL